MEMLNAYVSPIILGICLVVGYIVKHWLKVTILGVLLAVWLNGWAVTPEVILNGALSGLASTGMHQLFKQWIEGGKTA